MPIVRATISVVMFDTRQSPIEYHMRMSFGGIAGERVVDDVRGGRDRVVRLERHAEERDQSSW